MSWLNFYQGRGLVVDLASGKIRQEDLHPGDAESKVGGAALNLTLFQKYRESEPIILSTGPLTATFAPGSCLAVMTTKSPVNGRLYHVPLTYQAGAELRFSGLDYLVVLGQAAEPVLLKIGKGRGELTSAQKLWGKDIPETIRTVRSSYPGDSRCVLSIGPAGEGKTLYAQVNQNFWGTLDKAGFGTLWGRKKLKALLLTGIGGQVKVHPDHPALSKDLFEEIKKGCQTKTMGSMAIFRTLGDKTLDPGHFPSRVKNLACFHCPFPCQTFVPKERPAKFQPLLLTDPGGALAFRSQGKAVFSYLAECFRLGLEPMAAALSVSSATLLDICQQEEDLAARGLPNVEKLAPWLWPENEITPVAAKLGFSTGIPPISPDRAGAGGAVKEWVKRVASSLILGLCPILFLIAPGLNEEKLLAFLGTGDEEIAANGERLRNAARDLVGEMANP